MLQFFIKRRGQSILEYMVLVFFLLGAFLVFQKYIARGLAGRWKTIGTALGSGKYYDPNNTIECVFDQEFTNTWYDQAAYEAHNCADVCLTVAKQVDLDAGLDPTRCEECITDAQNDIAFDSDKCNS